MYKTSVEWKNVAVSFDNAYEIIFSSRDLSWVFNYFLSQFKENHLKVLTWSLHFKLFESKKLLRRSWKNFSL